MQAHAHAPGNQRSISSSAAALIYSVDDRGGCSHNG
jgi:hypothetical protein